MPTSHLMKSTNLKNIETSFTQSSPGVVVQKEAIKYVQVVDSGGKIVDSFGDGGGGNSGGGQTDGLTDSQLRASPVPVTIETATTAGHMDMIVDGNGYAAWPTQACKKMIITNILDKDIFIIQNERNFPVLAKTSLVIEGITNTNQITMHIPGEDGGSVYTRWEA